MLTKCIHLSEELGNEERAVEELKRHGSHQSLQSWVCQYYIDESHSILLCFVKNIKRTETITYQTIRTISHNYALYLKYILPSYYFKNILGVLMSSN